MKRFILTLGAIAILLPAGVILAQSDTRTDMQDNTYNNDRDMTVIGTIVSMDPSTVVVRTDDARTMTFTRDKDSDVDTDLTTGQMVKVEYSTMTGGLFHLNDLSRADEGDRTSNYDNQGANTGVGTNPPASSGTVQGNRYDANTGATTTGTTGTYDQSTTTGTTTTTTDTYGTARTTMPSTASPIPLVGLAGLLALGAGVGLRAYLRR